MIVSLSACGGGAKPSASPSTSASASAAPESDSDKLVGQISARNPGLRGLAIELAKLGDKAAIERAGTKLVAIAADIGGKPWLDAHRNDLKGANDRARLTPTGAEFETQLIAWQTDKLRPIVGAMEELGGAPVVDFANREVDDKSLSNDRRALSLRLLQRHLANADGAPIARLEALKAELEKPSEEDQAPVGKPNDTAIAVASLFDGFHACYDKARKKSPKLDVRGVLELKVGGDGVVTEARTADVAPAELATCVEKVGKTAKFSPKASGRTFTVKVPLDFQSTPPQAGP